MTQKCTIVSLHLPVKERVLNFHSFRGTAKNNLTNLRLCVEWNILYTATKHARD